MEASGVWERLSHEDCVEMTNKEPSTTKWVDIDQGRGGEVVVRCRLVARDSETKNGTDQFDVFCGYAPVGGEDNVIPHSRVRAASGEIHEEGE